MVAQISELKKKKDEQIRFNSATNPPEISQSAYSAV